MTFLTLQKRCCISIAPLVMAAMNTPGCAEKRQNPPSIREQYAFLVAFRKHASEEEWQAFKALLPLHGFEDTCKALRSHNPSSPDPTNRRKPMNTKQHCYNKEKGIPL